jgi:hypothetical protein
VSQIGPFGMTKQQWEIEQAKRNRPITDGPMQLHKVDDNTTTDGMTPYDRIIAEAMTEDRKQGKK